MYPHEQQHVQALPLPPPTTYRENKLVLQRQLDSPQSHVAAAEVPAPCHPGAASHGLPGVGRKHDLRHSAAQGLNQALSKTCFACLLLVNMPFCSRRQ